MHRIAARLAVFACLLFLGRTTFGDAPAPAHVLDRIAVVGASASFGFGARVTVDSEPRPVTGATSFADVVDATIRRPHQVTGHADLFFFSQAAKSGPRLMRQALSDEPTLFVGIDFLFWYGYGHLDRSGRPLRKEADRLALLEEGLKHLDQVECPIIVGDFPDMSPAVGRMLGENQMPKPRTLQALNQRLREWAAERPRVMIFPLAEVVKQMRSGESVAVGALKWSMTDGTDLIQRDQLHPTAAGLIALSHLVAEMLVRSQPDVSEDDFYLEPEAIHAGLERRVLQKHEQRQRLFAPISEADHEMESETEAGARESSSHSRSGSASPGEPASPSESTEHESVFASGRSR